MSTIPEERKLCSTCGTVLPLSEYYQKRPGKLFSWCKACHKARCAARYAADPERCKQQAKEWQRAHPEKAAEVSRRYRERHPDRVKEQQARQEEKRRESRKPAKKAYREANAEKIAAYREANRDHSRAAAAAYREAKREELAERQRLWREAHPERARQFTKRWKSGNKDAVNAHTHQRRAALKGGGSYTSAEWQELKAVCEFRCLMCGRAEPEIKLTVDHIVPVVAGGSNTIENLQPLCRPCNSRKHRQELDLRVT